MRKLLIVVMFVNAALTGNLVLLAGVVLGMIALALRAEPKTASNDLYCRIMLILTP